MEREETRARADILKDLVLGLVRTIIKVLEVEQVLDLARVVTKDLAKVEIKEAKNMDQVGI
jgi:hypothetical protein